MNGLGGVISLVQEFEKRLKKETDKYQGIPVAISGGVDSGVLAAFINPDFVISVDLPGGDKHNETKYAKMVSKHLGLKHVVVKPNRRDFNKAMEESVPAIGRPIPHFNIFPLWAMYKKLSEIGVKELILGDGPDETLAGYARNIIFYHLYKTYEAEELKHYGPTLDKILMPMDMAYATVIKKDSERVRKIMSKHKKSILKAVNAVDIELMRPDMDDMSNGIAAHFGIKNIRPYQDNARFDKWQFNLDDNFKVEGYMGKMVLRTIASQYLPPEIAWRGQKIGGPVWPVGKMWKQRDEFNKEKYLELQEEILNG